MNNEPVAWMSNGKEFYVQKNYCPDFIPLYTNPKKYCPSENNEAYEKGFIDGMAKMTESAVHRAVEGMAVKELTDEEIIAVGNAVVNHIDSNEGWIEFARAILRKAQEK